MQLLEVFETLARYKNRAASVLRDGDIYLATNLCIYSRTATEEELAIIPKDTVLPYKDFDLLEITEISRILPDVRFGRTRVPLSQELRAAWRDNPTNYLLVSPALTHEDPGIRLFSDTKGTVLVADPSVGELTDIVEIAGLPEKMHPIAGILTEYDWHLRRVLLNPAMVLTVNTGDESLFIIARCIKDPTYNPVITDVDGRTITLGPYSEKDHGYRGLRIKKGKGKMAGKLQPPKTLKLPVGTQLSATPKLEEVAVPPPVLDEPTPEDIADVTAPVDEPVEAIAAEVPVAAPVAVPEPESVKEEPQRKRRPKAEASGTEYDYAAAIAYLSEALPEQQDKASMLQELRNLRDLTIAAARRSTNLSVKLSEVGDDAAKTLEQMKALLG